MKLFNKFKENASKSPSSTKRGVGYSIFITLLGIILVEVGKRNPAVKDILIENQELIYTGLVALVGWIVHKFGAKKDD